MGSRKGKQTLNETLQVTSSVLSVCFSNETPNEIQSATLKYDV